MAMRPRARSSRPRSRNWRYLHRRTGWSSHLGVRDGTSVLYLLRISGVEQRVSIVQVGTRLPARNTVLGRVLLADLSEEELIQLYRQDGSMPGRGTGPSLPEMLKQRERDAAAGLVTHAGDFEARILSVAAPLRSADGRVVAAISLTAPVSPKAESELQGRARHELEETALKLSRRLGWSPEGDDVSARAAGGICSAGQRFGVRCFACKTLSVPATASRIKVDSQKHETGKTA